MNNSTNKNTAGLIFSIVGVYNLAINILSYILPFVGIFTLPNIISLASSIVGLILSSRSAKKDGDSTSTKWGKILGITGIISTVISTVLSIILAVLLLIFYVLYFGATFAAFGMSA